MKYYEVAPTSIVRAGQQTYTYSSDVVIAIGSVVLVPVGKKQLTGLVISESSKPLYDVRPVAQTIVDTPLPPPLVRTLVWISEYYQTPLATVLQTALPRGLTKKRRDRAAPTHTIPRERTKNVLNEDQLAATEIIESMSPGTALLHGVTGSGKTWVYIAAAEAAIASGRSVIVLVPEIALTAQLVKNFSEHFEDVILTHSKQTEAERHQAWLDALTSDRPRVIIGPRSALFMPLTDIGLIIIDECHEPSYKQEQSPRYSALRVASTLVAEFSAKAIFGSATPSVSDYFVAEHSKRPIISLPTLARHDAVSPTIMTIDMTSRQNLTRHKFFSDALLARIDRNLAAGEQILLFHNRRGSAATTLCESCGWQAGCARCFIPMTLHGDKHQLLCHICGASARVPTSCPQCSAADIIHKGIGTKLIESEIRKLYPKARIARFDGDTESADTLDRRYHELHDGSIDIIIGTQVIAKGLDLPHLRTVGVIQADAGLSLPDYSAAERTFQLLAQVIGRVGRSSHPTMVIVQTYQPSHPAVRDGIKQNYAEFYQRTLALRQHSGFPPFRYLLKLTCTYKTEATAIKHAQSLAAIMREQATGVEVLGPTPAFYERVRDTYRWQLVLRSARRQNLLDALTHVPKNNWQFELDPSSLL